MTHHIVGQAFLFPVDISPFPVLPAIISKSSPFNTQPPWFCVSRVNRWQSPCGANSPDIITISVGFKLQNFLPLPLGRQPPSRIGPHHCRDFTIILRHTTLGRTSVDEWSARRRVVYLVTHNAHRRKISMPPAGFKPATPRGGLPQPRALNQVKGKGKAFPLQAWTGLEGE
jgi:hypothetical protein